MSFEVKPQTFAAKHRDEVIRMASRSGGIFTALSDYVLEQNGVVYGAVLNDSFMAEHIRATTKDERDRMRGSKYIESRLGDSFKLIKKDLEDGTIVLFTGTSCQVAGLRAFLRKDYRNLIAVDILCKGVPSPKVWRSYLEWLSHWLGQCVAVDFRNKRDFGWADHVETISFKKRMKHSRVFAKLFSSHYMLRPSCYECRYKTVMHPGDLTIGDYWEIDRALPGFNDNRGVSLVMVNTSRGKVVFDEIKGELICHETNYEESHPSIDVSACETTR